MVRRVLAGAAHVAGLLALPVSLLLFAQWPLREWVGRGSTDANDVAQWLFALYVAVAVVHAGERGAHLVPRPDIDTTRSAWRRLGEPLAVLAWSLTVLVLTTPGTWQSLRQLERFPETDHAGYFLVKLALWLMAGLLTSQALARTWRGLRRTAGGPP